MIKLNLGSGNKLIDDYINIDIADGNLVYPLSDFKDESVDEIRASHILEHFSFRDTVKILIEWNRVLKLNGVLKIAVPDFNIIITDYIDHPIMEGYLFGGQIDEYDYHKALFTENKLTQLLWNTGFYKFSRWESEIDDCAKLPVSLNIRAIKSYGIILTTPMNYKAFEAK